jgi:predicted nucleotidyltransferase
MKATIQDHARLEDESQRLVEQLKTLGAVQIILFGSLARGQISLFSDIDLLVLFDRGQSAHELTRWVYQNIEAGEAVDILAYDRQAFQQVRDRPFFKKILSSGKVLHGPAS